MIVYQPIFSLRISVRHRYRHVPEKNQYATSAAYAYMKITADSIEGS